MNHLQAILRDTALCLIPAIGAGFWLDGAWGGLGTVATGAVVLLNVFLIGRLVPRLTGYLAVTDPAGVLAVVVLAVKFPLMLLVVTGLASAFGGVAVGLGLSTLVFGIFVRGVALMLAPPEPDPALIGGESAAPEGS